MSDREIDWKRHDERFLYDTLGHYAVFDRPDRKPEHRSPMQRVMRQIKEFRRATILGPYHRRGVRCPVR